jgi:hypothetical protein
MMKMKHWIAVTVLTLFAGLSMAGRGDHDDDDDDRVPEIDGALSIQMLALLGGAIYLIKRKK